ncbi:hypothetical protein JB92DRAFT_3018876 [Gautieria morchelliformis]|nr:hypothetical protein JB92DRAFT_3018876 [Gautieria morchelliformis]
MVGGRDWVVSTRDKKCGTNPRAGPGGENTTRSNICKITTQRKETRLTNPGPSAPHAASNAVCTRDTKCGTNPRAGPGGEKTTVGEAARHRVRVR